VAVLAFVPAFASVSVPTFVSSASVLAFLSAFVLVLARVR
jgi:hypothetical protein